MIIKIQLISETGYQTFPITDESKCIEVNEEDLIDIGRTKKFDLVTKTIISREAEYEEEQKEFALQELRNRRNAECFSYINRGELWYNTLTDSQIEELKTWYQSWLDVTDTNAIPEKPLWLD